MKIIIFALLVSLFGSEVQAQSFEVLNSKVEQGDVLLIRIASQWQQGTLVSISVFGKHYLPNSRGEVFIGIDKSIFSGKHIATLVEYERGIRLSWDYEEVEVVERIFPTRRRVPGKPRNSNEVLAISKAYIDDNKFARYIAGHFVMPLDPEVINKDRSVGDVYSPFGGDSHRGVDLITLDPKTRKHQRPVKAINSGYVVLVARLFSLEGNMIIIDHGSGIFSLYMHLSKFAVKQGDFVEVGQIIGISGKSGRVTGPHLHLAIKVGDPNDSTKFTMVDPLAFIKTMNENLNR